MVASVVRPSPTFLKDYSFQTTGPISIKYHTQHPGKRGKKAYAFSSGHMTKMTDMPIYNKNLKNILFQMSRIARPFIEELVM